MLSAVFRIVLLVLCLGASSFASASSHADFTQTNPVYTDVIETPMLNVTAVAITAITDHASTQQHQSEQAPTQKHPTDRYVEYQWLRQVSFYNTKLVWNFPAPTNIKFPLHSGKHHRSEVLNLKNIINTSTRIFE